MLEVVVLPVPEALPALYLVPVSMPHQDAECLADAALAMHVAEPLRRLARGMIGTPALAIAVRPLSDFAAFKPDAVQAADRLDVIAFASRTAPWPGPVHEWVTRAAAASVAAELDLPLVDCFANTVMEADDALATLPGSPDLAVVPGGFRLADWVNVEHADVRTCLITRGLRRFGLPELTVTDIPPELHLPWTMMLVAIGARVLEYLRCSLRRGAPGPFLELPAELDVGRRDISAAYGIGMRDGGQLLPVQLSVEPIISDTLGSYLRVDGPAGLRTLDHRQAVQGILSATAATVTPATDAAPQGRQSRHAAAARTRGAAARSQRQT